MEDRDEMSGRVFSACWLRFGCVGSGLLWCRYALLRRSRAFPSVVDLKHPQKYPLTLVTDDNNRPTQRHTRWYLVLTYLVWEGVAQLSLAGVVIHHW